MRRFKTKDLRRLHKAGQIKSHWNEIYQMRYKKTLAGDLLKESLEGWLLRIAFAILAGMLISMHPSIRDEVSFAIVASACGISLLLVLAGLLMIPVEDRLTGFVDEISLIAEWSNNGPADVLSIPEPRMLSLATGIISKAAAELLLFEANTREPRSRPPLHYRKHHQLVVAFNARYDLFGRLALLSVSDWSVNLAAGQKLIDDGLYPPKLPS